MSAGKPIRVLQNASDLVDLLAEQGALSPAEVAAAIDVPRPSVYRLAAALEAIGLVETLPDSTVRLTRRWLHLADASLAGMAEWRSARGVLDGLVAVTGQTAFLSVPRPSGAVCLDWAQGRGVGVLLLKPGRALPYHAGAAGRILLASDAVDVDEFLAGAPFERFTPHTLVDAAALRDDIAATRERGYSVSDQDVTLGIGALGVSIADASGVTRGCLSLGGLAGEIRDREAELAEALRAAAEELGVTLA